MKDLLVTNGNIKTFPKLLAMTYLTLVPVYKRMVSVNIFITLMLNNIIR